MYIGILFENVSKKNYSRDIIKKIKAAAKQKQTKKKCLKTEKKKANRKMTEYTIKKGFVNNFTYLYVLI